MGIGRYEHIYETAEPFLLDWTCRQHLLEIPSQSSVADRGAVAMVMASFAGSLSLFVLLLLVLDVNSFVYPDKRTEDERRSEGGDVAEEEAMIRELEEMQRRRNAVQLEEMIRSLVQRRIDASDSDRKKSQG